MAKYEGLKTMKQVTAAIELPYIEIGNRKFLLFEVDRISEKDVSEEIITNYINSQKERGDKVGSEGL